MGVRLNITGQKFGRLKTLYRLHNVKGKTYWLCVCDCGNLAEVYLGHLRNGHTKSCGCLNHDPTIKNNNVKHNKTDSRLYHVWRGMKARCYNKNHKAYNDYEPNNCRYVDNIIQQNNRRDNVYLTYNGETKSIKQWANELNINIKTLYTRKFKKWDVHDILFGREKQCHRGTMN